MKRMEKENVSRSVTPSTKGYAAYEFVFYCDRKGNFPDFAQAVEASGLPCFVVCHYRDSNFSGYRKPLHYHVMVLYDEGKEAAPVLKLCRALHGVRLHPSYCVRGSARYLCHLDNPDHYHYSPESVMCFNGCVYEDFIGTEEGR